MDKGSHVSDIVALLSRGRNVLLIGPNQEEISAVMASAIHRLEASSTIHSLNGFELKLDNLRQNIVVANAISSEAAMEIMINNPEVLLFASLRATHLLGVFVAFTKVIGAHLGMGTSCPDRISEEVFKSVYYVNLSQVVSEPSVKPSFHEKLQEAKTKPLMQKDHKALLKAWISQGEHVDPGWELDR